MTRRIPNLGLVLSFEERKRLADYFAILLSERKVLKGMHARSKAPARRTTTGKEKKGKKSKISLIHEVTGRGPSIRGPLFFQIDEYSWIKTFSRNKHYDRHYSTSITTRNIHHY